VPLERPGGHSRVRGLARVTVPIPNASTAAAESPGAQRRCSITRRGSLVGALEPYRHPARGNDGDQTAQKPVATPLGDDLMLQAVGTADCDDLLDLTRRIKLELPPQALGVGRLPPMMPAVAQ
jgi:hypothetical protein